MTVLSLKVGSDIFKEARAQRNADALLFFMKNHSSPCILEQPPKSGLKSLNKPLIGIAAPAPRRNAEGDLSAPECEQERRTGAPLRRYPKSYYRGSLPQCTAEPAGIERSCDPVDTRGRRVFAAVDEDVLDAVFRVHDGAAGMRRVHVVGSDVQHPGP